MKRPSDDDIRSFIPVYPAACSAAVLARNLGYLPKPPKTMDETEKGLRELELRLAWFTASEERIMERRIDIQDDTVSELRNDGFSDKAIPREMSYLSLAPLPVKEEKNA